MPASPESPGSEPAPAPGLLLTFRLCPHDLQSVWTMRADSITLFTAAVNEWRITTVTPRYGMILTMVGFCVL